MSKLRLPTLLLAVILVATSGCKEIEKAAGLGDAPNLVRFGGSVAVLPLAEEIAQKVMVAPQATKVRVNAKGGGTQQGFKWFCSGEVDVVGASRTILPSEAISCGTAGVEFIEIPIVYDGIVLAVPKSNTWADHLTDEELKKVWRPHSERRLTWWSEIREGFPDKKLPLFGPGEESGTYLFFTKNVTGRARASRRDFSGSLNFQSLVDAMLQKEGALGYMPYATFAANQEKLRAIPIKTGDAAPVTPGPKTVADGTYGSLTRKLYLYVSVESADRVEVDTFVQLWMREGEAAAKKRGYVPLPPVEARAAFERYLVRKTGAAE